jgi:autotransporter-associated beta strand protein
MKKFTRVLFALLLTAGVVAAAETSELGILDLAANGGINPATGLKWEAGDKYRFAFCSSEFYGAPTSSDIADYNTFVQNLGDASSLNIGVAQGVTWKAIGSTPSIDARDNTSTNPNDDGTGEATFRLDGITVIANDYADMWDNTLVNAIMNDEEGVRWRGDTDWAPYGSTWTGSHNDGTGLAGYELGSGGTVEFGLAQFASINAWIRRGATADTVTNNLLYALSDPLTIQGDDAIYNHNGVPTSWTTGELIGKLVASTATLDVSVYWSENDNADSTAWLADGSALSASIGTYVNPGEVVFTQAVSSLTMGTTYYYAFVATNAVTNMWSANGNGTMTTLGSHYWDGGTTNIPGDGDGVSAGGGGTWNTTTLNWDGGAIPHVAWANTSASKAVFGGAPGTVALSGSASVSNIAFTSTSGGYDIQGGTLNFASGATISNSDNRHNHTFSCTITGTPAVETKDYGAGNTYEGLIFAPATGHTQALGAILNPNNTGDTDKSGVYLSGSTVGNSVASVAYAGGDKYGTVYVQGTGSWTAGNILTGTLRISGGNLIASGEIDTDYSGLILTGGVLHYNNAGAVKEGGFYLNGGALDNSSGAAITTSTYNPAYSIGGNFEFIGSQGANSDLTLGTGAATLTGTRTVTVSNSLTTLTIDGIVSDGGNAYGLTKDGDGSLQLTRVNTYTGATTVDGGILRVDGSLNASSAVTVNSGGTLGGTGTVNGAISVASGGAVAPGASIGTFNAASNVTIAAGGALVIELDDTETPKNDTLAVTGELDITGATIDFDVTGAAAQFSYIIATYGTLTGTFGAFNNMPAGYTIDYAFAGGTAIAIKEAGGDTQPVVTNSVTDIDVGTATLRGELTDGTTADTYACWGTSDAGTNSGTSAWQHVGGLGVMNENAPFSTNLTGLLYGLEYNYRLYVTNSVGDMWSGLKTFTTPPPMAASEALGWTYTSWTGDADVGLSSNYTYTAAHCFGDNHSGSVTVNGVTLVENYNQSGSGWTSTGLGGATSDADAAITGDSQDLSEEFRYASGASTFQLSGLTAGTRYKLTFFSVAWEDGTRALTFVNDASSESLAVNQDFYGNNNGITISYVFDATSATEAFSVAGAFHCYALANRESPASTPMSSIANTAATNVTSSTADLVGTLDATGAVFTVRAYWGNNDNADGAAWLADGTASNMVVGTYTNVVGHSVTGSVASLNGGTVYYYTMVASNALTNIWADGNAVFGTDGPPTLINDGFTPEVGYSTLSGNVISVGGAPASVRIYWGATDGGTTAANWANTNIFSGTVGTGSFSTNTTDGLVYGQSYSFRCSASNANGIAWAPSTATFVTAFPEPVPPTANLEAWYDAGVGVTPSSGTVTGWADQSGNGRDLISDVGTPTFVANEVNGLPAVDFNADSESLKMANPANEYFSKETWLAFRSGNGTTFRGWSAPYGVPNGDDGDRMWMFENSTARFWTGEPPEAVTRNGEAIPANGGNFDMSTSTGGNDMGQFMVLRVVTGPNSGTHVRPHILGTRTDAWASGRYVTAELLAYNSVNSQADQDAIGAYLAGKYGIATTYPSLLSITNLPYADVTATSATFNASFKAELSLFDVNVYWGTSDGGDDAGAWGQTNLVGTFMNQTTMTNVSFETDALAVGTRYYYRFRLDNAATNIWGDPVITFQTLGAPTIGLGAGAEPFPGFATLNGSVVDGGQADITICWGLSDGGTNAVTDWDHNIAMGSQVSGIDFSADTTGALYGPTYYYRVYGTNTFGDDWSPVTSFTTIRELVGTDAIMHYGYHTGPDGVMNLNNNSAGSMMGGGDPTQGPTYYGNAIVTSGPGSRGLDFNDDNDFAADGAVGQADNYSTLFLGYLNAQATGSYSLRTNGDDDRSGIWLDLDQDGVFESDSGGLGPFDGEQLAWEETNWHTVSLVAGERYRVAFVHSEGGGGSRCEFRIIGPGVSDRIVKPADAVQAGLWTYDIEPPLTLLFENADVTGVAPGSAYLNATLTAPSQVYDVRAFWSTTDYGTNKADWVANGDSALVGSYTNASSVALTYQATGLTSDSTYYYAYHASNGVEEIFAQPSSTFDSFGTPVVVATGETYAEAGRQATLNGNLTDGGVADITICWGRQNAGTTDTSLWENVVLLSDVTGLAPFKTKVTDLTFGIPYYYACYATNSAGDGWSSVDSWVIGKGVYVPNALRHYGFHVSIDGDMDLHNNGGMLNSGDPSGFAGFNAEVLLTAGPGDRGLNFDNDTDFINSGAVTASDNYENLFLGYLYAAVDGEYQFRRADDEDRAGIWLDLDRDGVFESNPTGLGSGREEQLQWDGDSGTKIKTLTAGHYKFAATHREGTGDSRIEIQFKSPSMGGLATIKPTTDANQGGVWNYLTELDAGVDNTGVTGILPGQADLNGVLRATNSVYEVWVYWSTNNGATSKAAWLAEGDSQYMGTFTNVASTALVHQITGLPSATTYYYNFYGSNAAEEVWGDSYLFGSAGPPTVENTGGADTSIGRAAMHGTLTGGGVADIYVAWGTTDAGTNSLGAWEHADALGSRGTGVLFSNVTTEAYYGQTYYYRCFATNSLGTDWADSATSFATLQPVAPALLRVTDNLQLWLSADEGVTVDGADTVTGWTDRSGNGHTASQTSGNVKLLADQVNGLPAVEFRSNPLADVTGSLFSKQQYVVFRLANIGGDWGAVMGSTGVRSGYMMNPSGYFWSGNYPEAVRQNGGAELSPNYQLSDVTDYMVVRITGNNNDTSVRTGWRLGRAESWNGVQMDLAEIIVYDTTMSAADENQIGGYLAYKYGISTAYSGYAPPNGSSISNLAVSGVAPGQATLNAEIDCADAIYHVTAYWSTNDYTTNAADWVANGDSATVGSFADVQQAISHQVSSGLAADTVYYYAFQGTNEFDEIWGEPSTSFSSAGPPTVTNTGASALDIGTATLNGEIIGGGGADVYIVWGDSDAGTNSGTSAWDTVIPLGGQVQAVPFSTDISNTYYGVEYAYRVFASNVLGTAWSEADTFSTLPHETQGGVPVTDNLVVWFDAGEGVSSDGSGVLTWNDQSGNGHHASRASGNPALVASVPEINGLPAIETRGNNDYFNLAGNMFAREHYIVFRSRPDRTTWSNYGGILGQTSGRPSNYLTENNNTTFHNNQYPQGVSRNGTALSGGFSLAPVNEYMVVKIIVNTGDTAQQAYQVGRADGYTFDMDVAEIIGYSDMKGAADESQIGGYLAYKYGITTSYTGYDPPTSLGVENTSATNIGAEAAELGGTLNASGSVFTVTAYWSTTSNANAAAWLADGTAGSAPAGSYTNVAGQSVSASATGLTRGETYYYTMVATNIATNIWATPNASFATDDVAPDPDPMTFYVEPAAQDSSTVVMTASTAVDTHNNPCEYFFKNTTNFQESGWISSTVWTNSGLTSGTTYGYQVKARDAVSNETAYSVIFTATPAGDVLPPNPSPLTWDSAPAAVTDSEIVMTATTATDPNGPVEYYFENTNDLGNSGWITGTTWTNTGLTQGTTYGYRVRAQDNIGNKTGWSTTLTAVAEAPEVSIFFESFEDPASVTSATDATDPTGWADVSTQGDRAGLGHLAGTTYTNMHLDQAAWLNVYNAVPILQTTSSRLDTNMVADLHYKLSYDAAGSSLYTVYADLLAGSTVVMTAQVNPTTVDFSNHHTENGWVPKSGDAGIGEALSIRLRVTGGSWNVQSYVDNLRLTVTDTSGDIVAPTPDPMGWAQVPAAAANSSVTMVATAASDPNHVQYFFTNTVNGNVSGWQAVQTWTDTGLTDGVTYTYKVKARDKSANVNETAWSSAESATASEDILLYETFEAPPFTDVSGRTLNLNDQGWVSSSSAGLTDEAQGRFTTPFGYQGAIIYDNGGVSGNSYATTTNLTDVLVASTTYVLTFNAASENGGGAGYGVDLMAGATVLGTVSGNPNNTDMSATTNFISFTPPPGHANLGETLAIRLRKPTGSWNGGDIVYDNIRLTGSVLGDSTAPTPDPIGWEQDPWPAENNSIIMVSSNATDAAGVQYFFTNSVNGDTSGWLDDTTWTNAGLSHGVTYTYKVKARDLSASLNETGWSDGRSATNDGMIILYESFEQLIVAGRTSTMAPGWTGSDTRTGLWNEDSGTMTTPFGSQAMYVWNSRYVTSTAGRLGDTLTAGTRYTVTFNAAAENGNGGIDYDVELLAGATILGSVNGGPMGTSDMADFSDSIVFTPDSAHPKLGETLAVRLRYVSGDWHWVMGYDNVKVTAEPDETAPSPDPVGFAIAPAGINATSIVMTASEATDATGPVAYMFENTSNSATSGWSTNRFWRNDGLTGGNTYGYRVKAQDAVSNVTAWSAAVTAVAENETTAPEPDAMTFAVAPVSVNSTTIAMTATTAEDEWNNPCEYYFANTTNAGHNSGWILSTSWSDTNLIAATTYGYTVRARDAVGNVTADSLEAIATAEADSTPPNPDPMGFEVLPAAIDAFTITMTASNATDFTNPVEYYFLNASNSANSGWSTSRSWSNGSLTPGETYGYRVMARDGNSNETAYSSIATAVAEAPPVTIFSESFENPPHDDVTGFAITTGDSQGWVASGTAGLIDENSGYFVTDDGSQAGAMDDSGTYTTSSNLTNTLQAGVMYDLTFNIASKNGGSVVYRAQLLAGATVLGRARGTVASTNMADTTDSISFTAAPNDPSLGGTLVIKLMHPNENTVADEAEIYYDNILLTTTDTAGDSTPPTPDPPSWVVEPAATADNGLTMVASVASDTHGVQYFFTNTGNGNGSGWQDAFWWTDSNLTANATYTYKVKARDNASNLNETGWSVGASGTVDEYVIFYESFETPEVYLSGAVTTPGWYSSGGSLLNEDGGLITTPYGAQIGRPGYNGGPTGRRLETTTAITDVLNARYGYTLTFNAGNVNGSTGEPRGDNRYTAEFIAGSTVLDSVSALTSTDDMSETNAIVYETLGAPVNVGETLKIRFYMSGGDYHWQPMFDNIRLRAVPLPPPASLFLFR